ncbi:MAG: ATP-binding cassette domain-containing protein [Deferribacterales bacterium]
MNRLLLKDINIKINNVTLLDIDNFVFEKGFINTIIGKSGIGKSTLLKVIGGLVKYEGSIYLDEKELSKHFNIYQARKKVHYVRQDAKFIEGNFFDNIKHLLSFKINRTIKITEPEIFNYAEKLGLERELLYKDIKTLSGGEKQRLNIIRSLLIRPEFILLDEPTSALDIHTEGLLINLLNSIKNKIGIITVSHSYNFIRHSDNKILLSDKRLTLFDKNVKEEDIKRFIGGNNA